MSKIYVAGSSCWEKIGNLTRKEKFTLIKNMEIGINNNTTMPDEYFYWIIVSFEEYKSDAVTFREFIKNKNYLEKLEWLRLKNLKLEYRNRTLAAVDTLSDHTPSDRYNELLDTCTELTALIT